MGNSKDQGKGPKKDRRVRSKIPCPTSGAAAPASSFPACQPSHAIAQAGNANLVMNYGPIAQHATTIDDRYHEMDPLPEDEQRDGRGHVVMGNPVYNYYHGPVNNIGSAYNANFGTNYGHMNLAMQRGGSTAGGHSQATAGTDIISLLNPILDASHTRNMKVSPPNSQCLPGTRRAVIGDIRAWADRDDIEANPHMLWIYGYAGCGKSAIAHEIAKIFADEKRLAACFVFFRGSGDRSSAAMLANTVASQVASAIPEIEPIIESTIRRNPGLLNSATASLSEQFKHLVYLPVQGIASQPPHPFIIVLDGADECQDRDEVSTLIEDMIEFFDRYPAIPLRFLIASRVEDHLHQVLHSSRQVKLLNLVERTSDDDIAAALDVTIANAKRGRLLACDESWPDSWDRRQLVRHIGGSFLFMTVIIKRLFDRDLKDGLTPMERLPLVLSMKANFDDLYREILTPRQELPHFQSVISTIALTFEPLSVVQLADILAIKAVNVVNVLINLQAVIQLPGDDRSRVTLWHTSLRDFLCAEDRSGSLFAKPSHHLRLALRCASLAVASVQRTSSPLSAYSQSYAIKHLMQTTGESLELSISELRGAMNYFQRPVHNGNQTVLEVACRGRHWQLVCALIDAGANVKTRFSERRDGIVCALHAACFHNEWETINLLLGRGADPNTVSPNIYFGVFCHGTPLAFAARKGDAKLATRLLECGADPNLRGGVWDTALQAACVDDSLEVVNLLLDHGADPNLRGGEYCGSPLRACAVNGHDRCARALLMRKADPNIQDSKGDTPLQSACEWGRVRMVECLLEFKADTSIRNDQGQTIIQLVRTGYFLRRHKGDDAVRVLRRHGILE